MLKSMLVTAAYLVLVAGIVPVSLLFFKIKMFMADKLFIVDGMVPMS